MVCSWHTLSIRTKSQGPPLPSQLDPGILLALAQVALAFPFFSHQRANDADSSSLQLVGDLLVLVLVVHATFPRSPSSPSVCLSSPSPFAFPLSLPFPWFAPILPIPFLLAGPTQTTTSPPSTLPDPLPDSTHSHVSKFLIILPFSPIFSTLNLIPSKPHSPLPLEIPPFQSNDILAVGLLLVQVILVIAILGTPGALFNPASPSGNFGPESTLPSK